MMGTVLFIQKPSQNRFHFHYVIDWTIPPSSDGGIVLNLQPNSAAAPAPLIRFNCVFIACGARVIMRPLTKIIYR